MLRDGYQKGDTDMFEQLGGLLLEGRHALALLTETRRLHYSTCNIEQKLQLRRRDMVVCNSEVGRIQ